MKMQRFRFKLLALLLFLLLGSLALYGGYSIESYGNRWFTLRWNPRLRVQKARVTAGDLVDRSRIVLATTKDGKRIYAEDEATRRALVHVVGDEQSQVKGGAETFQAQYLLGFRNSLPELVSSLISGAERKGDTVQLTVDSALSVYAADAFTRQAPGKSGCVIVMNYQTGEVLAMTSLPNFDPMAMSGSLLTDSGKPFWNRATQAALTPGSTFKIVTTLAALGQHPNLLNAAYDCNDDAVFAGQSIRDFGGVSHGTIGVEQAFAVSCNRVYARLAVDAGYERLLASAQALGWNDEFLFRDMVLENSRFPGEEQSTALLAMLGIGQGKLLMTPMHLCMIASAVANDGVMMEPRLLGRVTGSTGAQRLAFTSAKYRDAMTADQAAVLKRLMRSAVTGGSASALGSLKGQLCAKTGTAESSDNGQPINYAWCAAFSQESPYAAVALVEGVADGQTGGSVAAPILAKVFDYLGKHPVADLPQPAAPEATSVVDAAKQLVHQLLVTPNPTTVPPKTPMPTITPTPAPATLLDTVQQGLDLVEGIQKILTP